MSSLYTAIGVDPVANPRTQLRPSAYVLSIKSRISLATSKLDSLGSGVMYVGIFSLDRNMESLLM